MVESHAGTGIAQLSLEEEISRLRAANEAAAKENSRLRAEAADRQYESSQLEKQIRRLERKIEAVEDAQSKKPPSKLATGFFKPATTDAAPTAAAPEQKPAPRAKPRPWERALAGGAGVIIDSVTGEEVDPNQYWPEEGSGKEANVLLRAGGHSPEAELMKAMQNPPETNSEFDTARYAKLMSEGRQQEAEEMIQVEGGPTLEQMQKLPLEVLRKFPALDPNWCDVSHNSCSLLQWACSMGYDEVTQELLARRADPCHSSSSGMSCLAAACAQSWSSCAHQLLTAGADPNEVIEPAGGQRLLMWASRIDYADNDGNEAANPFVELLLAYRCDVNATDSRGQTALMHASTHGSHLAVEALLAARADVDAEDSEGNTALQIALRYYHGKISSMLLPLRKKLSAGNQEAPATGVKP